jgi:hypothetical protein
MASSSADAHSQPRRPPPMARQASSSSHISQSPSEALPKAAPKAPRQHVVGHGRIQRNASSKNLTKLNKTKEPRAADDGNAVKHHRRSHSGNSTSAPSSPRPSFKRNASSGGIVRAANATIRKNYSSGHLARQGASKPALKSNKSEIAVSKRSLINPDKGRQSPPDASTGVHFDVADDEEEGPDDGWTEESASQSPTTTRSNTRSNSVIMDPHRMAQSETGTVDEVSQTDATSQRPQAPHANTHAHILPDRSINARQTNGASAHHHSRPPDADMITSRLLQRNSHYNAPPQMSTTTATVVSNHSNIRESSQSAGSTLVDTPGRDLVSRFIDGEGSAGTPNNSSFLPSHNSPQGGGSEMDRIKRNKSMPNVAGTETPIKTPSRRSGTSTPTDLPVSRTQQKLMLQRASSNIEPQKLIPVILPRTGGPTFLNSSMTYSANGEGRLDPRLQQQFNHVALEYNVVRRYRNPIADALLRIEQIPGTPRKSRVPRAGVTNGSASVHGSSSLSTSFNDETERRRSRVSYENRRGSHDDDVEGRQSFDSDHSRVRNEAEEICRRLWESVEAVEHD